MKFERRALLGASAAGLAALWVGGCKDREKAPAADAFPLRLSDAEWRKRLSPAQYDVLRRAATERPFSSPLDHEQRRGTYVCAGCALPLFASDTKFDSGTGWPSFFRPLPDAVVEKKDSSLLIERTEIVCRRCGGHLGHVFNDGPKPTGLRYCMNGLALRFIAT